MDLQLRQVQPQTGHVVPTEGTSLLQLQATPQRRASSSPKTQTRAIKIINGSEGLPIMPDFIDILCLVTTRMLMIHWGHHRHTFLFHVHLR